MLSKDKLIFDEADLDTSDQVGAHILGTANEKISSTNVGGKEGLDVNIINSITVALDSEYAEDSAHADGDMGVAGLAVRQDVLASSTSADGDYGMMKQSDLGELYVKDSGAISELQDIEADLESIDAELVLVNSELDSQTALLTTIDASLDVIEAIDFATETTLAAIKAQTDQFTFDAGRLEVLADIDLESDVADDSPDTENPLKVGSRAVSGLLSAISASGDKANLLSDMYRRVFMTDAPNVGASVAAVTVAITATQLDASLLAGRTRVMLQNLGSKDVYVGFSNAVTTSSGIRVARGSFLELPFGENLDLYAIGDGGSSDVRIAQIG